MNSRSTTDDPVWLRRIHEVPIPQKLADLRQKLYQKAKQRRSQRAYKFEPGRSYYSQIRALGLIAL